MAMKEVAAIYSVFEADIMTSKLKDAGIEAFAHGRETAGQIAFVTGPIRIFVLEEDYENAVEVLN